MIGSQASSSVLEMAPGLQIPPMDHVASRLILKGEEEKKKMQLLYSGFAADAERTDLPAGSSAINWMSYSSVGYGFGISLAVLEKAHGAEPRWMRGPGWGPGGAAVLFSGVAEGGMEEPSLGADNLGRVRNSSKLWPGPSWLHEGGSWVGEHILQCPAAEGLEVEQGKGDGNWVTGEEGREELGISQQRWERSHAFRVWERLPGCKYPFPAPKLPQESSLLLQAAGTRGPGIPGLLWQCESELDPAAASEERDWDLGFWFWLTRITWTLSTRS